MEKRRVYGPLVILIGLVTRHYGLTLEEMMKESKLSRMSTFRYIKTLESLGVRIERKREPVKKSWRTLYRVSSIRGNVFSIRRQA
jgi:predicted DNA-binding transcriptional regulator YafY